MSPSASEPWRTERVARSALARLQGRKWRESASEGHAGPSMGLTHRTKETNPGPPMATSERPPPDEPELRDSDVGDRERRDGTRRLLERILREGVRRAVEKGVEKISDAPDDVRQFVQDLKLPREIAGLLLQQIDDTKNGLYRAVAKELRDFLEQTNLAEEITRALTALSFEIKTEIRFIPNEKQADGGDSKLPKPDVKASVRVRDGREPKETRDIKDVDD